ncbi:MAG: site-2 protease family protein [Nitrososphaeria archaeon]
MEGSGGHSITYLEDITSIVRRYFNVVDFYVRSDGAMEYTVSLTEGAKEKFLELWEILKKRNYVPVLKRGDGYSTLYVAPYPKRKKYSMKMAFVMLAATVTTVLIDGWLRTSSKISQQIFPDWDPIFATILYLVAFMGILGLHEIGHLVLSRKHGMSSTMPYFIPGIPGTGIPSFGAVIFATEPMANRDMQFDVGLSGPVFGFIAALVVGFFGVLTSVSFPLEEFNRIFGPGETMFVDVPLIMNLMMSTSGRFLGSGEVVVVFSPLAHAAWFGFLVTFLNTLPAWQLDGGHMARSVLSGRQQRIVTILSALVMALFGFFLMALLVLFFSQGQSEVKPLDEVSPLSRSRKIVFALMIGILILCAPIPI